MTLTNVQPKDISSKYLKKKKGIPAFSLFTIYIHPVKLVFNFDTVSLRRIVVEMKYRIKVFAWFHFLCGPFSSIEGV